MIKVGSLVKLNPKFYSLTINVNPLKDMIGIVVQIQKNFYKNTISLTNIHTSQDRYEILFGDQLSYESENAIIEFLEYDENW